MSLYATITRITDETSTVRVFGPAGATPLEQRIEHQPAPRTSLNELDTAPEQASAAVLTTAATRLLTEHGFTVTDAWRRLGTFVPTYGAHATRNDRCRPDQGSRTPRLPGLQVSGFSLNASGTRPGPAHERKDFTMTTPMPPDASSPRDPMAPLTFAPSFTAPYEVEPGTVRHWQGMSGRVYTDYDGWFHHPEAARPLAALSAWFSDGPMTEVTSTR